MLITDRINSMLDKDNVIKILQYCGVMNFSFNGHEIRCSCPIHGGTNTNAFVWNLNTGLWFCFTGCADGGNVYQLIQRRFDKKTFKEAIRIVCDLLDVEVTDEEINKTYDKDLREQRSFINHMKMKLKEKQNVRYDLNKLGTHKRIKAYRNLDSEILNEHGVSYIPELNRVSFPIKDENGLVVGSSGRTLANIKPKWCHYPDSIRTGLLLYGLDSVDVNNDSVVIVEGIIDCLNLRKLGYKNTVCTFGANITREQIKLLVQRFTNVLLMYDNDESGEKATKKFINFYRYLFNIKVADLSAIGLKDPGEILTEEQLISIPQLRWFDWLAKVE